MPYTNDSVDLALLDSVSWVQNVLIGPAATSIAVLAVAVIGVLTLSGRVPVRRGASVIVGCFILFSANLIAASLVEGTGTISEGQAAIVTPPAYAPSTPKPVPYDPYAGAAVPIAPARPSILQ